MVVGVRVLRGAVGDGEGRCPLDDAVRKAGGKREMGRAAGRCVRDQRFGSRRGGGV